MSLAGTRLGPYEVLGLIGAGGMGEVYRARDTDLERDVAIKVLPDVVARDAERLTRFQREAQLLASLNHPNIAHIHGLQRTDGMTALVMELVDGATLADRIARGPIPVDEALPIAMQIAEALEAAHEQGIIHRDLKPANIKLRDDGTVKVLDFGLAKVLEPAGASNVSAMNSPTMTGPAMTAHGIILGTAAYMAPEQTRGKVVDKRADIWAFGCVVYEMLTGTRAFEGETLTDLLAAVVKHEPDWNALPPDTPGLVRSLLRRCLQKDPVKRLHDIADARIEIQEAMAEPETPAVAHRTRRERVQWAWIAIGVGVAASVATWWLKPPPFDAHVVTRLLYAIPEGQSFTGRMDGHRVAISPDGTKLVYVANEQLYLRFMDQLEAQPIRGTNEDPMEPVFSPNGQEIAYFVPEGGRGFTAGVFIVKKIAVSGGTPVPLAELPRSPFGASWHDTRLVFGMNDVDAHGIQSVPDGGGTPQWLVSIDPHTSRAVCPQSSTMASMSCSHCCPGRTPAQ
jgi:serine/threonine-protein kinase